MPHCRLWPRRLLIGALVISLFVLAACSKEKKDPSPAAPEPPAMEDYGVFADRVSMVFGGDTSFGESYGQTIRTLLRERGYDFSFAKLKPLMMGSDFSVLNVETPITDLKQSKLGGKKEYVHWTDIEKAPATLRQYKVRLVSLANNHTLDYGLEGLKQTFAALHKVGIPWIGAGRNEQLAQRPYVAEMRIGGAPLHIAFLAGYEYSKRYDLEYGFYARGKKGGAARLEIDKMLAEIRQLRQKYPDLYVIVFPHWGGNYAWRSDKQLNAAHELIDGGADLIIGHGAHRYQELEKYNGKWIVYNLGNFIFNAPGRFAKLKSPPYGLVARLVFEIREGKLVRTMKVYPILSDNKLTEYVPRFLDETEFADAYRLLGERAGDAEQFARLAPSGEDEFGRFIALPMD